MRSPISSLVVAAALGGVALAGCSASDTAAEKIAEASMGGDVDIESDGDGNVSISTPDGVMSTSADLPEDFPDDVPVVDGTISAASRNEIDSSTLNFIVSITTDDGAKETVASLSADLEGQGWTQTVKTEGDSGTGYGGLLGYEKGDDRELTVSIGPDATDPSKTLVQYIVTDRAAT